MPKSKRQIAGRVRSAYEFMKAHRDRYSVQMMCRVLEVAPSGYSLEPRSGGRPTASPDPRVVRRESRHLRRPSGLPRPA